MLAKLFAASPQPWAKLVQGGSEDVQFTDAESRGGDFPLSRISGPVSAESALGSSLPPSPSLQGFSDASGSGCGMPGITWATCSGAQWCPGMYPVMLWDPYGATY